MNTHNIHVYGEIRKIYPKIIIKYPFLIFLCDNINNNQYLFIAIVIFFFSLLYWSC